MPLPMSALELPGLRQQVQERANELSTAAWMLTKWCDDLGIDASLAPEEEQLFHSPTIMLLTRVRSHFQYAAPEGRPQVDDLLRQKAELLARNEDLVVRLEAAYASEEQFSRQLADAIARVTDLQDENDLLQENVTALENANLKLAVANDSLEDEVANLRSEVNDLDEEISLLRDRIGDLEDENSDLQSQVKQLLDENYDLAYRASSLDELLYGDR